MKKTYESGADLDRALRNFEKIGRRSEEDFLQIEGAAGVAQDIVAPFAVEGSQRISTPRLIDALSALETVKRQAEDIQRQISVVMVLDLGKSLNSAAKAMGKSHTVVTRWVKDEVARRDEEEQ